MADEAKTIPGAEAAPTDAKAEKAEGEKPAAKARGKKKPTRIVSVGRAYVQATYNNTIVTLTDPNGNVLGWSSAGVVGFKGPKKSTPYAASVIVKDVCDKTKDSGLKEVSVFVCGVGSGREGAVRALHANGLNVTGIKDITPIPHNGCRAPKPRRV
ncbi:MAG TPA: 30S ribosomal protein S11 [Candidatus Binatia bacterium]|nr:30S ribosomal protein S11 [Candidatus Binatia bacterium]